MLKSIQSERGVFHRLEFRKLNQNSKKSRKEPYSSHTHTHPHPHKEMEGGGNKGVSYLF